MFFSFWRYKMDLFRFYPETQRDMVSSGSWKCIR